MITWALLLVVLCVVLLAVGMSTRSPVPWQRQLRRLNAGVAHRAEWMAPDAVVAQVAHDYLAAMRWLQDSALLGANVQQQRAPRYFTEAFLEEAFAVLARQHTGRPLRFVGVLRADHQLQVRHFSEDGGQCVVVDRQRSRRMATYHLRHHTRVLTQDLGEATLVYRMVYDRSDACWKVAAFVQQLPPSPGNAALAQVQLSPDLPQPAGRDS